MVAAGSVKQTRVPRLRAARSRSARRGPRRWPGRSTARGPPRRSAGPRVAAPPEPVERPRDVLGGDPLAVVADLDPHEAVLGRRPQGDHAVGRGVADGVLHQVVEHALQLLGVALHRQQRALQLLGQEQALLLGLGPQGLEVSSISSSTATCESDQLMSPASSRASSNRSSTSADSERRAADPAQRLVDLGALRDHAVLDPLDQHPQRGERRAQVVRHRRDEAATGGVGRGELVAGLGEPQGHAVGRAGRARDLVRPALVDAPVEVAARRSRRARSAAARRRASPGPPAASRCAPRPLPRRPRTTPARRRRGAPTNIARAR